MSNEITAYFKGRIGVAESVYQNDYGMVMVFDGIDLPAHFDCYFSILNQDEAIPGVGADNMVTIPNAVLANPGKVEVHIPLHNGANDSEVEYVVYFKIIGRARPIDDGTPTQMTAIEQALALLQNPITNIEQIVNEALAFTGETFEEMQEDLDEWKGGVESDFDNLDAQFQTAVAAVTTDTEVTNIRVGDDNVIYTTAGEAVRTQFANVKSAINKAIGFDPAIDLGDWVDNSYVTTGGSFATYNGWHRTDYVDISAYQGKVIHFTNTGNRSEQYNVIYDQNKAKITTFNTNGFDVQVPSNAYYMAISLENTYVVTAQIKYDAYTDRYWLLNRVSFSGTDKPTFNIKSSSTLTISFVNGATMWALGDNGVSEKRRKVFGADVSYDVYSGHPLVWDITDNSVSILNTNDAIDRYIVLADYNNGKFNFGALLPYFEESQKALITYNYPHYYDSYMKAKLDDIEANMKSIGTSGDAFVFVTDTHWLRNRKHSPELVRTILSNTQICKVIHGGDIPYAYETEEGMYEAIRGENEAWSYAVGDKLYQIIGNHDIHATDNTDPDNPIYYELTNSEVYGLLMKKQENRVTYNPTQPDGCYYCFDNLTQKIRYICLNNFQTPAHAFMSNYQVSWVGDRCLELASGWSVVFIGHCSIIQAQNPSYSSYVDIKGLITALANKTSFTASYGRTFDFTNSDVEVVGYFAGHEHIDDIDVVDGVTYILTTCDALLQDDGYNRAANTVNEQAFDVVQINTYTKHVDLVRIGAGSDREFDY